MKLHSRLALSFILLTSFAWKSDGAQDRILVVEFASTPTSKCIRALAGISLLALGGVAGYTAATLPSPPQSEWFQARARTLEELKTFVDQTETTPNLATGTMDTYVTAEIQSGGILRTIRPLVTDTSIEEWMPDSKDARKVLMHHQTVLKLTLDGTLYAFEESFHKWHAMFAGVAEVFANEWAIFVLDSENQLHVLVNPSRGSFRVLEDRTYFGDNPVGFQTLLEDETITRLSAIYPRAGESGALTGEPHEIYVTTVAKGEIGIGNQVSELAMKVYATQQVLQTLMEDPKALKGLLNQGVIEKNASEEDLEMGPIIQIAPERD